MKLPIQAAAVSRHINTTLPQNTVGCGVKSSGFCFYGAGDDPLAWTRAQAQYGYCPGTNAKVWVNNIGDGQNACTAGLFR